MIVRSGKRGKGVHRLFGRKSKKNTTGGKGEVRQSYDGRARKGKRGYVGRGLDESYPIPVGGRDSIPLWRRKRDCVWGKEGGRSYNTCRQGEGKQ